MGCVGSSQAVSNDDTTKQSQSTANVGSKNVSEQVVSASATPAVPDGTNGTNEYHMKNAANIPNNNNIPKSVFKQKSTSESDDYNQVNRINWDPRRSHVVTDSVAKIKNIDLEKQDSKPDHVRNVWEESSSSDNDNDDNNDEARDKFDNNKIEKPITNRNQFNLKHIDPNKPQKRERLSVKIDSMSITPDLKSQTARTMSVT